MDKEIRGNLIVLLVSLIICVVLISIAQSCSMAKYNGGICRECGGKLVIMDRVGHQNSTDYYFECEDCGHIIVINSVKENFQ